MKKSFLLIMVFILNFVILSCDNLIINDPITTLETITFDGTEREHLLYSIGKVNEIARESRYLDKENYVAFLHRSGWNEHSEVVFQFQNVYRDIVDLDSFKYFKQRYSERVQDGYDPELRDRRDIFYEYDNHLVHEFYGQEDDNTMFDYIRLDRNASEETFLDHVSSALNTQPSLFNLEEGIEVDDYIPDYGAVSRINSYTFEVLFDYIDLSDYSSNTWSHYFDFNGIENVNGNVEAKVTYTFSSDYRTLSIEKELLTIFKYYGPDSDINDYVHQSISGYTYNFNSDYNLPVINQERYFVSSKSYQSDFMYPLTNEDLFGLTIFEDQNNYFRVHLEPGTYHIQVKDQPSLNVELFDLDWALLDEDGNLIVTESGDYNINIYNLDNSGIKHIELDIVAS